MKINQLSQNNLSNSLNYPAAVKKQEEPKSDGTSFRGGGDKDITNWVMAGLAIPCIAALLGTASRCGSTYEPEPEAKQVTAPVKKPVIDAKTVVLPPLTMVDVLDTLEFKSYADSLEYRKYSQMARASHDKIEKDARAEHDSIINAAKKDYETVKAEADKILQLKLDEINTKYDARLKEIENSYNDGKMSFGVFDSQKQTIEQNRMHEEADARGTYWDKVAPVEEKYHSIQRTEDDKFWKLDDENDKKLFQDIDSMRAKYCKNVRKWQPEKAALPPLTQSFNGLKIKYNSKDDSIQAQEYINGRIALMKEHQEEFDKLSEEEDSLLDKIDVLDGKMAETEYSGSNYDKLTAQQDELYTKLGDIQTKQGDLINKYGLNLNEIRKHGKTNLSCDYYWTN